MSWLRQTAKEPLFPEILWSRPENKRARGKLLIIGGNLHSFASVSEAYAAAKSAGAGTIKVLLPDVLSKTLSKVIPEAIFVPSTPSGSFASSSLAEVLDAANWADGVLLAGDFGKNSETTILLESFAQKYTGRLTLGGDCIDHFFKNYSVLLNRPDTLVVGSISPLQKVLAGKVFFKHSIELQQLVTLLEATTKEIHLSVLTSTSGQVMVACGGQVSTTLVEEVEFGQLSAYASVFWLQNPSKIFEAITSAIYDERKVPIN